MLVLLKEGVTFPIADTVNPDHPAPAIWSAEITTTREIDYESLSRSERSAYLAKYHMDKSNVVNGVLRVSDKQSHVYDGGEFVSVDTETGHLKIRWQHAVSYSLAPQR